MAYACDPGFGDQYMGFAYDQYIWMDIIIDIRRVNMEVQDDNFLKTVNKHKYLLHLYYALDMKSRIHDGIYLQQDHFYNRKCKIPYCIPIRTLMIFSYLRYVHICSANCRKYFVFQLASRWWLNMKTRSALLAPCKGILQVTPGFTSQKASDARRWWFLWCWLVVYSQQTLII